MADDAHAHDHHGVGHIVPYRILVATGGALFVLTWVTVAVARVNLGEANIFVALAIAAFKASLVALFFMHLRWDRPFNTLLRLVSSQSRSDRSSCSYTRVSGA